MKVVVARVRYNIMMSCDIPGIIILYFLISSREMKLVRRGKKE